MISTRMRSIVPAALLLFCVLASCARGDEQAIRHLVISELMQREHLPEGHIEIETVRFLSAQEAIVVAKILPFEGRAGMKRTVRCKLQRSGGRWSVDHVEGGLSSS